MKRLISFIWILTGLSHLSALSVMAESSTLPSARQAIFFRQIFSYDEALNHGGEISVLVLEPAEDETGAVVELTQAFQETGVIVKTVSADELTAPAAPATVIYVLPSSDFSLVKEFCSRNGVLSISGEPTLAENGHASISLGNTDGNPEIIINRSRLKVENHKLSSHLLRLAKLIN